MSSENTNVPAVPLTPGEDPEQLVDFDVLVSARVTGCVYGVRARRDCDADGLRVLAEAKLAALLKQVGDHIESGDHPYEHVADLTLLKDGVRVVMVEEISTPREKAA